MGNEIIVTPTSRDSAVIDTPIVLKVSDRIRLIFKSEIFNNPNNPSASVHGDFIYQRKSISDTWENINEISLSTFKTGEKYKLHLTADELLLFISEIQHRYQIKEQCGIPRTTQKYIITSKDVDEKLKQIIDIIDLDEIDVDEIDISNIDRFNIINGILQLKSVLKIWEKEKNNDNEKFWQKLILDKPYLISYAFSYPIFLYQDQAFLGGKNIHNKDARLIDFIYKNQKTNNTVMIEIKTPFTKLMSSKYREKAFSIHNDLTGAINQVLDYKDAYLKYFHSFQDQEISAFDPKIILIAGRFDKIDNKDAQKSFILFRNNLRNIDIITFDELFERIGQLISLFENKTTPELPRVVCEKI